MAQESILRIVIDSRNAERNAQNIARELQSIERNGDHASRSMDSMSVATRSLVGYMGGLVTIGAAINKMDNYTGLQNRLKLVTDSQGELNTAMNDTFAIAQKTASSWDSTAMVYQRFADSADRLGISMKQTASLTETVSKAISVSGGSAASAEAALMQFGQALASGVLRGEEFNSIAEQAPGLLKAIAFGLDTNIGSLRAMAADGKITGDVLVDALGKAKPYIDDLFNKTDFTISQSFTQLSNEVTKFVGEAGKGSGAAAGLSAAIGELSDNLGTIANIAVVGGVALLTKTILTQTVAIQGSIVASIARRAALLTEIGAQAAASAAEVRRTAALAQFTAMQLVDAQATAARMVGLQRHAYIEATVLPLRAKATQMTAAHTAATAADTVVQNANNVARARSTMLLGLVGGPIGAITLGVAGLAAGYMYLKAKTAEATAKLEEQGKVALETDENLKKLTGNDKKNAVSDLTAAFNAQNAELSKSKEAVDAVLFAIRASSVENEKARKVTEDAKNGVISYNQAIELLNKMDISPELYEMLKKQVIQYDENAVKAGRSQKALSILGLEFKLSGNKAQNAVNQLDANSDALDNNKAAADKAAEAQKGYQQSLADRKYYAEYKRILTETYNFSQDKAEEYAEARKKAGGAGATLAEQTKKGINETIAAEDALEKSIKARGNAASKAAKAQSDAARKAKQTQEQARREAEQLRKEQFDLREQYTFDYADREKQIELDLAREIADIRKANFANPEPYLEAANKRAYYEKQIYLSQLQFEINEFQMSEEQKLKYSYDIKSLQLEQNSEITKESKEIAIKALGEQYQQELGYIKLAKEQRMFQMREQFLSETAAMEERYRIEHMRLIETNDLEERNFQQQMLRLQKQEEVRNRLNNAVQNWGQTQADMNGTGEQFQIEQTRFSRYGQSQELFDSQMSNLDQQEQDPTADLNEIALLREQAWFAHHDRLKKIETDYQVSSMQLQLSYGEQMASSMTTMMGAIFGEKSRAYAAAFAIEKGFAVAQAALAMGQNIAEASKAGFPYNIPLIAGAMAQGAQIASIISSVAAPTGYATGGLIRGPGTGTSDSIPIMASDEEFMIRAASVKKIGAENLDYINKYGELPQNTKRVGMGALDAINNGGTIQAEKQAQANAKVQSQSPQIIDNQLRVLFVKDEQEAKDMLYGPDGEKAFLYHMKRNRSKV